MQENRTELLVDFCRLINDNIRPFGMQIKKAIDEHEGKSYYGLVSSVWV